MIRTKNKHKENTEVLYSVQEEPIVISKALIDLLLKQENGSDLIALYIFYYYTAKWQRTNQPKATTSFVAKGLDWGVAKVVERKKTLKKLGLIEDVQNVNSKGVITGTYIHVNFIWSKEGVENLQKPNSENYSGGEMTTTANIPPVVKSDINTLPTNSINALSKKTPPQKMEEEFALKKEKIKKPTLQERSIEYLPLAQTLSDIVKSTVNVTHTSTQIKTWSNDIRRLEEENKISYARIEKALEWYRTNINGAYVPVIMSGHALREKFLNLEKAMKNKPIKEKPNTNGYIGGYEFKKPTKRM